MSKFKTFRFISRFIQPGTIKRILHFFSYYFGGLIKRIDEHHIFLSGGGIAFSLILSLIPFILLLFCVLGNIISPEVIEQQIINAIDTIIPYPEYADYTKKAILDYMIAMETIQISNKSKRGTKVATVKSSPKKSAKTPSKA